MSFKGGGRVAAGKAFVTLALALGTLAGAPALASAGAPTITFITPSVGLASGGTSMAISGNELEGATAVYFGSTPAKSFTAYSKNGISLVSPPGTGVVEVTVETPEGISTVNAETRFQYLEPPEFGTCEKLGFGRGTFTASGCQTPQGSVTGNAEFEWFPAFESKRPLIKSGFTLSAAKGITLETIGKTQVKCASGSASGEYSGNKTVQLGAFAFSGCASRTLGVCEDVGAEAGKLKTQPLSGVLGITEAKVGFPARDAVGIELAPASGETVAAFSCGGVPVTLRGALIVEVKADDKMAEKTKWAAAEKKGVQKTTHFEGGPEVGLQIAVGAEGIYEAVGAKLNATEVIETSNGFTPRLEIDTKF
jgi:hypothetical protein